MKHLVIAGFVFAAGLAVGAQAPAKAELKDAQGQTVGTATLTDTPHGVLIHAVVNNVPAGTHAFHIHQTGACVAPFTTAGGHFNPAAKQHGIVNPMGMHAGDMPNIEVPAGGQLTFDVLAEGVTLAAGPNSVFDADGSALVLHQTGDDYKSDPAGNAGTRIACGVITK
ncbi:MAG: superoxide dismutase family protein [Acidobacteriota bacterium]